MPGISRNAEEQPERLVGGTAPAQGHVARRELLHQISNFLLDLELEVNPGNLTVAQEVVSGTNRSLSRQIAARQSANEPVTQAWLDDVLSEAEQDRKRLAEAAERETLNPLIGKLEQSLQQFAQNAGEAGANAAEYHAALFETATTLEAARPVVELPALTQLTRNMLERTRIIEEEMRRREAEAAGLREALQLARADAAMDRLTGMDNPRTFDAVLEREYNAARDSGEPLSIAFCGIDRFQAINDTHGRDAGTRLIQALAKVLQRISGENCHIARHGGEGYVLLFRGIAPDQAHMKLDEARQEFARRKLINRETDIPIGTVTFSGGVADVFAYADARGALKATEEALHQAKEQGRNRILVAHKPGSPTAAPSSTASPPD